MNKSEPISHNFEQREELFLSFHLGLQSPVPASPSQPVGTQSPVPASQVGLQSPVPASPSQPARTQSPVPAVEPRLGGSPQSRRGLCVAWWLMIGDLSRWLMLPLVPVVGNAFAAPAAGGARVPGPRRGARASTVVPNSSPFTFARGEREMARLASFHQTRRFEC